MAQVKLFQSTPPARGATAWEAEEIRTRNISIHAPREGGDDNVDGDLQRKYSISIHAPREGGDS